MFESNQICPYTGLRSFTEEESLYFKGREEDIDQATLQLQRNKFLMLTGASGDGKSSLIYAGIIPNARSGFLKSKYSRWCVADFRPERDPFGNLCSVVARELDIPTPQTVGSELKHGFSALVDLYKNSKRYLDTDSAAFQSAPEPARPALKREAANLIILVDQFEEFFTNPENYRQGVPTKDAGLVLNLLLEAARIALDEGLPIYIVFTMRSDYIGQCAAFRGLAEYIGFSQFFVSRLNRSQLQQVIEEPAVLSGNRINRRLTERLIHDITEGVDQLPILQHALNQIWLAAANGREEMDLIHYAMVGGMGAEELPDNQVSRFEEWFKALPAHIRDCYHVPRLQNVLDTHTNKLYEEAAGYYHTGTGKIISEADAKEIIRTAFTCLTKIDRSRAVRNRMTLRDVTNILGRPDIGVDTVNEVLNIFREPGNTFVQPFIDAGDPGSRRIAANQVLDITHESLIRNWVYLGQWAKQEFDSRSISIDFGQQLDRWVTSGKSRDFLLSIGPLTYFENWKHDKKPNEWWIARYLPDETDGELRLAAARATLTNANEFIARSAARHRVTRALVRLGSRRIAGIAALLALVLFSSFAAKNYFRKQNSQVLASIQANAQKFANKSSAALVPTVLLMSEQLKSGRTTIPEIATAITDPLQRANIATGIATLLVMQGKVEPAREIRQALELADSTLENLPLTLADPVRLGKSLKEINDELTILLLADTYRPNDTLDLLKQRAIARSARWVKTIFEREPPGFGEIQALTTAWQNAVNLRGFSDSDLEQLIKRLSPFENGLQSQWLRELFRPDKVLLRGSLDYGFKSNGLYQQLAALYAAVGNAPKALQCIDTLIRYGQVNLNGDYSQGTENGTNIASVFYTAGKADQLDAFVEGYAMRKNIVPADFYQRIIGRTLPSLFTMQVVDLFWWTNINTNRSLIFNRRKEQAFYNTKFRQALSAIKDNDERNFKLAMAYKNEGLLKALNKEIPEPGEAEADHDFDLAIAAYSQVSPAYLAVVTHIPYSSGEDQLVLPRSALFVFPDYRTETVPFETRSYFYFGTSNAFLDYIFRKDLFHTLYSGPAEVQEISTWLAGFYSKMFVPQAFMLLDLPYNTLQRLDSEIVKNGFSGATDWNRLYLDLGYRAQEQKDTTAMIGYYRKIRVENILSILHVKEFDGQANDLVLRKMASAAKGCLESGQHALGQSFISVFKNPINRSSLYALMANLRLLEKHNDSLTNDFIDSARTEMQRTEDIHSGEPNRQLLAAALVRQNPERNKAEAFGLIKNVADKTAGTRSLCGSFGFREDLYDAVSSIPALTSDSDIPYYYWYMLHGYVQSGPVLSKDWDTFSRYDIKLLLLPIRYIDENN